MHRQFDTLSFNHLRGHRIARGVIAGCALVLAIGVATVQAADPAPKRTVDLAKGKATANGTARTHREGKRQLSAWDNASAIPLSYRLHPPPLHPPGAPLLSLIRRRRGAPSRGQSRERTRADP